MKKLLLVLILVWTLSGFINIYAENLKAYLSYSTFVSPEHGPYIETYLAILGRSISFVKNDQGKFQGMVEVTLIFKQDSVVKDFEKYELLTQEVDDTSSIDFNLIDQKRFVLPNGTYEFEVILSDKKWKK
ncbi:hypothetical protein ACFLRZ_02620 [Bacteroidota bacterium]